METAVNIKIAAISLMWRNPVGEDFVPWLKEVKAAGYDGVAGFPNWGWQDYIDDPGVLGRMLSDQGLALANLAVVGVDPRKHKGFDLYHKVCGFMANLGSHHLVCVGGKGREDSDFTALGALLNDIGEIALQYGIRASYHHHTDNTGETFTQMERLLSETDPQKFFVMSDIGHATKDFVEFPVEKRALAFLEKYWERMDFIEFKDWHPEMDLDVVLGQGMTNYPAVFDLLKRKKYSGWITVEQNHPSPGKTAFECARLSREFIRKGLGA